MYLKWRLLVICDILHFESNLPNTGCDSLCITKVSQDKLLLHFLGYQGDGWWIPSQLIYDWLPEIERHWRQHCLSEKFRDFLTGSSSTQKSWSALKKDSGCWTFISRRPHSATHPPSSGRTTEKKPALIEEYYWDTGALDFHRLLCVNFNFNLTLDWIFSNATMHWA